MKIAIIGTGIAGNVAAYHLHREHDDLFQAVTLLVFSLRDEPADSIESVDVVLLRRKQRILPEVWEHSLDEVLDVAHLELDGLVGPIRSDRSALPSFLELVEELSSVCVLADREARSNLPAESMSRARLE